MKHPKPHVRPREVSRFESENAEALREARAEQRRIRAQKENSPGYTVTKQQHACFIPAGIRPTMIVCSRGTADKFWP